VDMSTQLLLEVAPKIDTNPTSFYRGRGRGSVRLRFGLDSPVGSIRSAVAMSVHPTYFDLATPLMSTFFRYTLDAAGVVTRAAMRSIESDGMESSLQLSVTGEYRTANRRPTAGEALPSVRSAYTSATHQNPRRQLHRRSVPDSYTPTVFSGK